MTWIGARLHDLRDADAKGRTRSVTEPTQADSPAPRPNSIQTDIIKDWKTATILLKQALPTLAAAVGEWEQENDRALYREIEAHIAKMEGTE